MTRTVVCPPWFLIGPKLLVHHEVVKKKEFHPIFSPPLFLSGECVTAGHINIFSCLSPICWIWSPNLKIMKVNCLYNNSNTRGILNWPRYCVKFFAYTFLVNSIYELFYDFSHICSPDLTTNYRISWLFLLIEISVVCLFLVFV